MKKILLLIFLLDICSGVQSQSVQKITSINYYGFNGLNPSNLTVFDGKLWFFGTDDPQYVNKLMFTADGSAEGVTVVKQIDDVVQYPSLRHLTVLNNLLIFDNMTQLWRSDGTETGTLSIATLKLSYINFAIAGNKLFFTGDLTNSNPINDQLWTTDGTSTGTALVKTINPSGPSNIVNLFAYSGNIYFSAYDGVTPGNQIWISDGTATGTKNLKQLNPSGPSNPGNFCAYNGKVYFAADDGVNGIQLWVTDGTTEGTIEVTSYNMPGSWGLQPSTFTLFDSKLYFMGMEKGAFFQLWSTDGTTAGTKIIKTDYTIRQPAGFRPKSMAVHKDKLYMTGYDSLSKTEQLWVTDGTTEGTVKVTAFPIGLFPDKLFSFKNRLIMTGYDTISGQEQLFASDGTATGTVCPTPPDTWGQYPFYPWEAWVPFKNELYYKAAYAYFADYQLCKYIDGPLGVQEECRDNISVYPNPTNGIVNMNFEKKDGIAWIEVIDQQGRLILRQSAQDASNSINLTGHAPGVYYLSVFIDNRAIAYRKIILI